MKKGNILNILFLCSKDSETCESIPCGTCGPDCVELRDGFEAEKFKDQEKFEVKVIDTFTGDSRVVYSGVNRIKALNSYQDYRFSERFEVEFYKNGELRFFA